MHRGTAVVGRQDIAAAAPASHAQAFGHGRRGGRAAGCIGAAGALVAPDFMACACPKWLPSPNREAERGAVQVCRGVLGFLKLVPWFLLMVVHDGSGVFRWCI